MVQKEMNYHTCMCVWVAPASATGLKLHRAEGWERVRGHGFGSKNRFKGQGFLRFQRSGPSGGNLLRFHLRACLIHSRAMRFSEGQQHLWRRGLAQNRKLFSVSQRRGCSPTFTVMRLPFVLQGHSVFYGPLASLLLPGCVLFIVI